MRHGFLENPSTCMSHVSHLRSHRRLVVTLQHLHPSAQFTPSISSHIQSGFLFYHGTPLAIEPWHLYESGIMFTVSQHTLSYTISLGSFKLAEAFAHIQLVEGHILCSLVLLNSLHGMRMLRFYFSIVLFIRLACINSIYSTSRFSFAFIIISACFIYLSYLVVLSLHIHRGPLYTLQKLSYRKRYPWRYRRYSLLEDYSFLFALAFALHIDHNNTDSLHFSPQPGAQLSFASHFPHQFTLPCGLAPCC